MKNKILLKNIILILLFNSLISENNINVNQLLKTADRLEKINKSDDALKIYIELFDKNKSNSSYFALLKYLFSIISDNAYKASIMLS